MTPPSVGPDLLWRELRVPPFDSPRAALFLDRDGVLIEERNYLSNPEQVVLLPGAAQLISLAHSLQTPVVTITNQAGIGYGKFGWEAFEQVEARVHALLKQQGASVDGVFACPFHEKGQDPYRRAGHPWRKPNPGMLLEAARLLNLALGRSLLVGDKVSDIAAARNAGLPSACIVRTGYGPAQEAEARALEGPGFRVHAIPTLMDAAPFLPDNRTLSR
jgi:D-glycero-D-manno-heptose 1,7-bisphosphate phosphatase